MEELNKHFSKENIKISNNTKRFTTLLIIREIQIKTTMRYHLIHVRMAFIKHKTLKVFSRIWRKENSFTLGVNVN